VAFKTTSSPETRVGAEGGSVPGTLGSALLPACAFDVAGSRGTFGLPKRGMAKVNRLVDGFSEDSFCESLSVCCMTGVEGMSGVMEGVGNAGTSSSTEVIDLTDLCVNVGGRVGIELLGEENQARFGWGDGGIDRGGVGDGGFGDVLASGTGGWFSKSGSLGGVSVCGASVNTGAGSGTDVSRSSVAESIVGEGWTPR
jgi:hypothetical protein